MLKYDEYSCYGCKKVTKRKEAHDVKIVDYKGESFYREVCSEECFNKVVSDTGEFHLKRYREALNQKFK